MNSPTSLLMVGVGDGYYADVFNKLHQLGVSVDAYTSHYLLDNGVLSNNQAIRIDETLLYLGRDPFSQTSSAIEESWDESIISAMYKECYHEFMVISDRLSAVKLSVGQHNIYFRNLVLYFTYFFNENTRITHVFFESTPHFTWDLVLFYVARHLSKIPLIMQRTDFDYQYIIRSDWNKKINIRYNNPKLISPDIVAESGNSSIYVKHSKDINYKSLALLLNKGWRSFYIVRLYRWVKLIYYTLFIESKLGTSATWSNPKIKRYEKIILFFRKVRQGKLDFRLYKNLSRVPDFSTNYVYFALHFQPERSTQPEGGIFEDQLLAIVALSNFIPLGWKIFVKEHPRQFDFWPPDLRRLHSNRSELYSKLGKLKNVVMMPIELDSEILIKNSEVCSTISGSVGWQAINQGKPSIVFSNCWYSECNSCENVSGIDNIKEVIIRLASKSKSKILNDRVKFLKNIKPYLFSSRSLVGGEVFDKDSVKYQSFVNSLSEKIFKSMKDENEIL